MITFIKNYFSVSTADDQKNYFTGDCDNSDYSLIESNIELKPGNYRIIDGKLCYIVSNISKEDLKGNLKFIAENQ